MQKSDINNQLQLSLGIANPRLRDTQDLMAFPFFSLCKKKRVEPIQYDQNGISIIVRGVTGVGIATIWDADFLIWAASQLNEARERGEEISPRLWVIPYRFFKWSKRINTKSEEFRRLLVRLQGTQIITNIKAGGKQITEAWSWIDTWKSFDDENGRTHGIEVVLSDWFFKRVVKDRSILSISPDYFLISGGIERWLYKIARKHCGENDCWFFNIRTLYQKYPPGREFRKFKADLKQIAEADCLPEYHVDWHEQQQRIMFRPRDGAIEQRRFPRALRCP